MGGIAFDSPGYSKRLIQVGFSQEQAETLADLTAEMEKIRIAEREKYEAAQKAEREKLEAIRKEEQEKLEAERRNTLATKADIMAVKADIEKVRAELKTDIEKVRIDLLKWQIGIAVAILAIMAKGFGWLGF